MIGSLRSIVLAGVAGLGLWVGHVGGAHSAPLPKDVCDALLVEEQVLDEGGARANLAKGADWGRTNLDKKKLGQVQRLIKVTEDLVFRCGLAGQRFAAFVEPAPPPPPPAKKAGPKAQAKKPVAKAKAAPKPKPEAKTVAKPQGNKPKPDDAYRPPAKTAPVDKPKG